MNFNLMVITSLIGLDSNEYDVDSVILEDEFSYQINAKLKETTERKCPHCGSKKVVIKDYKKQFVKHQVIKNCDKKVIVCLTKPRDKCKDCGSTYMPKNNFVRPGCNVSNKMCWEIADRTKDLASFKTIADDLKLSENTVISVFDQMVKIGRKPLTTAICIDEKHFHSNYGKYVCVISNPVTSEILNLIPSHTKSYLIEFFKSLSKDEKNSVKYVISDMFEPYRTIIKRYLPNAIHIIDHFHVTRLFTSAIQIARIRYMKSLRQDTFAYKYIKKNWKIFVMNQEKNEYLDENFYDPSTGEMSDFKTFIKAITYEDSSFHEIFLLYLDYCKYMVMDKYSDEELETSLDFLINKALSSTHGEIRKIGETLLNYYYEILNLFTSKNKFKFTNGVAEALNNNIDKLLGVSYGLKSFKILKKRILWMQTKKRL